MTQASWFRKVERVLFDNSPTILTVLGVTGTVTTAYLTGKASFRAHEIIMRLENGPDQRYDPDTGMTLQEMVQETWHEYIPAVGMGATTIFCIVASNRISNRRAAAVAAAYSLSEKAFTEYREKVVEKIGEKKEHAVREEIAQTNVTANDSGRSIVIGDGKVLCFEQYTGRYFESTMENIKKAQNDTNYQILGDGYASLTDFYARVGIDRTPFSDEVGWNSDKRLELSFSSVLTEDSKPCLAFSFTVEPIREYQKFF